MKNNFLTLKNLGIDTQHELVVFMPKNCNVCRSEGFEALTRLQVHLNGNSIIATLFVTNDHILLEGEASLSVSAWNKLGAKEGDHVSFSHLPPLESLKHIRAKIYGRELNLDQFRSIIHDVVEEKYSNVQLAAFIAACSGDDLSIPEICYLTRSMIEEGTRINWQENIVADKHCIGGVPGNRTTMIVVPILAAVGIPIPKTSSRAITSPAGTADTMEVVAPVNLTVEKMKEIVKKEGGCIAWGGSVKLSPADDILIRVERALDVDSEGQMVASILSKKAAAGSTHCLIDIPVGETAKVRTLQAAHHLANVMQQTADYIGLKIKILLTEGTHPVGRGIGPSLEARDVLKVLRNEEDLPIDLKERSLQIAGSLIELVKGWEEGAGLLLAKEILESGKAYEKFHAICLAQGGFQEPKRAQETLTISAEKDCRVDRIDNRTLARIAKLAGAPAVKEAGVDLHFSLGDSIKKGQALFTIHSNSTGELNYARDYYLANKELIIQEKK